MTFKSNGHIGLGGGFNSFGAFGVSGGSPEYIKDNLIFDIQAWNTDSYPGSGTAVTDLSVTGNDATLTNGTGFSYPGFTFDGVDDLIVMDSSIQLLSASDFTINIWMKKDSYSYQYVCDVGINRGLISLGVGRCYVYADDWLIQTDGLGATWHSLTEWFNLTIVKTGTTNCELYLNGSSIYSQTPAAVNFGNGDQFQIGDYGGNGFDLSGEIGSFMIYDVALNSTQVLDNYNALLPTYS